MEQIEIPIINWSLDSECNDDVVCGISQESGKRDDDNHRDNNEENMTIISIEKTQIVSDEVTYAESAPVVMPGSSGYASKLRPKQVKHSYPLRQLNSRPGCSTYVKEQDRKKNVHSKDLRKESTQATLFNLNMYEENETKVTKFNLSEKMGVQVQGSEILSGSKSKKSRRRPFKIRIKKDKEFFPYKKGMKLFTPEDFIW